MSTQLRYSFVFLTVALILLNTTRAVAQAGAAHGAALSALGGGGCQNLTGFNPPAYPGSPGRIPCQEYLRNVVTFQTDAPTDSIYQSGAATGTLRERAYAAKGQDPYLEQSIDSRIFYGGGNDNYAEFSQDGANRARSYSITVPGLVMGVNANPIYRAANSIARVVDGYGIGFSLAGESQVIQVPLNGEQSVELFPIDPYGFANRNDPNHNPYRLGWVTPNMVSTPHSEIVSGIEFRASFDQSLNTWRYFLDISGPSLRQVGKYIVYFFLEEVDPRTVQYRSQVEGIITSRTSRYVRATLTVAYGLDQCAVPPAVHVPDMKELIDRYQSLVSALTKSFKIISRKGVNSDVLFNKKKKVVKNNLALAGTFLSKLAAENERSLAQNLVTLDMDAVSLSVTGLRNAALTLSGGAANQKVAENPRRLVASLKRLLRTARLTEVTGRKLRKTLRKLKISYDQFAVVNYPLYVQALKDAQERAREAKVIAARCQELP